MKFAKPSARASQWGAPDGTQTPIVRINAGRQMLAVSYSDLPGLIEALEQLHREHDHIDELIDRLVVE